jgi:hypothetical protein
MCVMSMIFDHYHDKWGQPPYTPWTAPTPYQPFRESPVSDEEIKEFRKLLERAREYDRKNNQPDCELEEKRQKLKKLSEELGVKIDFI